MVIRTFFGITRIHIAGLIVILATTLAGVSLPAGNALALDADAPVVLITGSNRGIGLGLARHFAARGWNVIATCRNPDKAADLQALAAENPRVVIEQLDVTDTDRIKALSAQYKDTPIDVLLNNAGISGGTENESLGKINYEVFNHIMAVNAIAPIRMAEAFMEQVAASDQKKIMNISSGQGSVALVRSGRLYFYRSSKRALNMMMHSMAKEVAERGIVVGLLGPGAVDTDMMRGIPIPKLTTEKSASDLYQVIAEFDAETSGMFISHDGETVPW